jgi:hypothetical protein
VTRRAVSPVAVLGRTVWIGCSDLHRARLSSDDDLLDSLPWTDEHDADDVIQADRGCHCTERWRDDHPRPRVVAGDGHVTPIEREEPPGECQDQECRMVGRLVGVRLCCRCGDDLFHAAAAHGVDDRAAVARVVAALRAAGYRWHRGSWSRASSPATAGTLLHDGWWQGEMIRFTGAVETHHGGEFAVAVLASGRDVGKVRLVSTKSASWADYLASRAATTRPR